MASLQIVRHDDAGDATSALAMRIGAVDQVANLRRRGGRLHKVAGHILEQGLQIEVLLIVRADRGARLLPDDREYGLMVELLRRRGRSEDGRRRGRKSQSRPRPRR